MSTQTQTQIADKDLGRRAELVRGLRELAQFFEDHPEMPIPRYPDLPHCVHATDDETGIAEIKAIAATLGVEVDDGTTRVNREFAGLTYHAFYNLRDDMRRHNAHSTYLGAVEPDDDKAAA